MLQLTTKDKTSKSYRKCIAVMKDRADIKVRFQGFDVETLWHLFLLSPIRACGGFICLNKISVSFLPKTVCCKLIYLQRNQLSCCDYHLHNAVSIFSFFIGFAIVSFYTAEKLHFWKSSFFANKWIKTRRSVRFTIPLAQKNLWGMWRHI